MIATNAFKQAVVGTYTNSDTVIELNSISNTIGNADYLPNGGFNLILYDGLFGNPADANNAGKYEILECSSVNYATNEITVVRARENTTAVTIDASSWQVVYGATVAFFAQFEDADATILKQADVVDNLTSTSTTDPLSANQGKQLEDTKIATSSIVNDLTTGGTTVPLSAEQGKELKTQLDAKGKVLQVVQGSTSTEVTVSSSTYTDSNLTGTITPTSATSKILVMVGQQISVSRTGDNAAGGLRLLRGSTEIYLPSYRDGDGDQILSITAPSEVTIGARSFISFQYLDSPESASAVTYKTQIRRYTDGHFIQAQNGSATSTITLMEIEG